MEFISDRGTGDEGWIANSLSLAEILLEHFEDRKGGGFFYSADDAEQLITRNKDWHDGSLVSGNASATTALLHLSRLCGRDDFRAAAERTLRAATEVLKKQSAACGALLSALDRYHHDDQQIVLAVPDHKTLEQLRPQFLRQFRPHTTVSWVVGEPNESIVTLNHNRESIEGKPTLYRCRNFVCEKPLVGDAVQF